MARFTLPLEIFLIILLFSQSAFCLQCYVCSSGFEGDCNFSPPPEKYRVECSSEKMAASHPQHLLQPESQSQSVSVPAESLPTPHENATESGPVSTTAGHDLHDHEHAGTNRSTRSVAENKDVAENTSYTVLPVKLPKEATFCRKIVNHIPAQNNGPDSKLPAHKRVVRSCGYISKHKEEKEEVGCRWIGTDGIQKEVCACTGDGCNSGNYLGSLKAHTLVLFSVMTIGYFYIL